MMTFIPRCWAQPGHSHSLGKLESRVLEIFEEARRSLGTCARRGAGLLARARRRRRARAWGQAAAAAQPGAEAAQSGAVEAAAWGGEGYGALSARSS